MTTNRKENHLEASSKPKPTFARILCSTNGTFLREEQTRERAVAVVSRHRDEEPEIIKSAEIEFTCKSRLRTATMWTNTSSAAGKHAGSPADPRASAPNSSA